MNSIFRSCLFAVVFTSCCLADEAPQPSFTKEDAIAKATQWLQTNHYARVILDSNKKKDLLDPKSKVYSNSVTVSDGLKEVRFHHNGRPYDSDSISFTVEMDAKLSLVKIEIQITSGGFE